MSTIITHRQFPHYHKYTMDLAGRPLTLEVGKLAELANAAVMVTYGETSVLCCVTAAPRPRDGIDFFPLSVDFEEKLYAVGRIPGSFNRREGRPGEKGILTSRVIDRPIRPLFPHDFRNDVSVMCTVMSVDHDCSPEICGLIGTSAALAISDIPWNGPVGALKVGLVDGKLVHVFTGWDRNSYELREGYRILNIGSNGAASADYVYCHLSNGQLVTDSLIRFDAVTDPDHPWFRGTGENDLAPITDENWSEDEVYSAAASLPIAITPFADASAGSYDPALADYEGYLSTIDTSSIKYYALRDLDGDGQNELLLYNSGETLMKVAAIQNGTAQEILSGNVLDLCEGNVLEEWDGGSGAEQRTYYRVENHTAVPFECIIYNIDENQCYRDSNYDFYEENLTPITEEEYNRVVNTYPGMSFWDCNPKPLG